MAVLLAVLAATGSLAVSSPRPVVAEASETYSSPRLYVSPSCLSEEGTIKVSGVNFTPNTTVYLWDMYQYFPGDPEYGNSVQAETDDAGSFGPTTLSINEHYAPHHNITASYSDGYTYVTGVVVAVCDARVSVSPKCAVGQKSLAVTMSDFYYISSGGDPINVQVQNIVTGTVVGNANFAMVGLNFTGTITFNSGTYPSGLPSGQYRIVATQGDDQASSSYRRAISYFSAPCPTVKVAPICSATGSAPDTMSIQVITSGFISDGTTELSDVEIVFDDGGQPQEFVTDSGSPDGTFLITPYRRGSGTYTITAKQGYWSGSPSPLRPAWTDRRFSEASTTLLTPCPVPTLSLDPNCGQFSFPGEFLTVTYSGSNFIPTADAVLVMDVDGIFEVEQSLIGVDGGGDIYGTIKVEDRPDGIYKVKAYQDVNGQHFEANTTWKVPCIGPPATPPPTASPSPTPSATPVPPTPTLPPPAPPYLTMSPTCMPEAVGQPGAYVLSLTGGGFVSGTVTLVLDPTGAPSTGSVEADLGGYVNATFTTDGRPPGTYELLAYQDVYPARIQTSATLSVPCATLTLAPACADPAEGRPGAYTLAAGGVGFDPGPVDLVFDAAGLLPMATQALADANGVFSMSLVIEGKPPGIYDVVASQSSAYGLLEQSIAQFLVPCNLAIVRITPSSGQRGFVPIVEGFGFPPATSLMVHWDLGIGAELPVTVLTDDFGYFRCDLVVFQHDFLGLRHVIVQDPTNALAYTALVVPYMVAAAPIQPPFSSDESPGPTNDPVILQR